MSVSFNTQHSFTQSIFNLFYYYKVKKLLDTCMQKNNIFKIVYYAGYLIFYT